MPPSLQAPCQLILGDLAKRSTVHFRTRRYRSSVNPDFSLAVVVDDDPDIALAAKLALRDMFERVEALPSPSELMPLLKRESPDAILLDLNFQRGATDGREGIDALARIMTEDPDAAVVIITLTGVSSLARRSSAAPAISSPSLGATNGSRRPSAAPQRSAGARSMRGSSAAGYRRSRMAQRLRCSAIRRR